ncbi:MAG: SNF2 helicase associated domain-containing protein [Ruminiclostridium sp.]|nr:SNF2 helicase associated domain-containing protein [Ruminiclostridium sp.]
MLSEDSSEIQFALEDLPAFCSYVLLVIDGYVTVDDPDGLLEEYLPEDAEPCFWFNMQDDILTLKLTFRYGESELSEGIPAVQTPRIHRNIRREKQSSTLAE